jgi:hypothetical protein
MAPNARPRTANGRPTSGANGSNNSKGNKFANAGAAAGGFVGAMGGSFVPPINVTVNNNRGAARNGSRGPEGLLPAPEFTSPAQVRNYCNTLRAAAVTLSIEVAMGAEILKGVLAAVPDPEGRPFGSRIRAAKVARKMQRASDDLRHAAKSAAACYATFQQEFEEEINRVRHRARKPQQPAINWDQQ